MFRPRNCTRCGSGDVHRYERQWLAEYFFLFRPYRCFGCNQRFTTLDSYVVRTKAFLAARAERAKAAKSKRSVPAVIDSPQTRLH